MIFPERQTKLCLGFDGNIELGGENLLPLDPHRNRYFRSNGKLVGRASMLHTLFTLLSRPVSRGEVIAC